MRPVLDIRAAVAVHALVAPVIVRSTDMTPPALVQADGEWARMGEISADETDLYLDSGPDSSADVCI